MAREITIKLGADTRPFDTAIDGAKRRFNSALDSNTASAGKFRSAISASAIAVTALGVAGAAAFKAVASAAIDSAIAIDKSRNALIALTGSAEAANRKMAELRKLAASSPGVTSSFATDLFAQLKAVGGIADQAINTVIKSLGKLNTVFGDIGPDFARNLQQIFTQGFERSDIKEALGRVPIFEQLLESAFGTKDPDKLRQLKAAGKLTLETFLTGFSTAINTDPRFAQIQESIGSRIAKVKDNILVALAPFGDQLLALILPALESVQKAIEGLNDAAQSNFGGIRTAAEGLFGFLQRELTHSRDDFAKAGESLRELRVEFEKLSKDVRPLVEGLGELFQHIFGNVLHGSILVARGALAALSNVVDRLTHGFQVLAGIMRDVAAGAARLAGTVLSPGGTISGGLPSVVRQFLTPRQRGTGEGLDGEEITQADFNASAAAIVAARRNAGGGGGGGGELSAEAKRLARERAEQIKDLLEKINDAKEARLQRIVDELEGIEKSLTASVIEEAQRRRARPSQLAGFAASNAERLRQIDLETLRLEENTAKAAAKATEELSAETQKAAKRAQELDSSFRFMRGLRGETDQVADSFERLGQSIGDAFGDVKSLLGSLASAVKQFFGDILSATLRTAAASALSPLFGGGGGAGGGILGNLFRTPSFAGGGNGISAPPSVSQSGLGSIISSLGGGGGGIGDFFGASVPRTAGSIAGGGGFSLSGILGGLAGASPLLGLSLGSGFGGSSTAGNILGAIGGGAVGLGVSFGASVFSAGGGLGQAALAALGPIALIGAPLIVGAILLGKAAQRRKDEEASGQFLTAAQDAIVQLKAGIASDQIDGSAARAIFDNNILGQFRQQIGTLKTASVRESRLTNQVRDLRGVYDALIPPEIAAQQARVAAGVADQARIQRNTAIDRRLIPEFATGGIARGGLALMHPNEMVLTVKHQRDIQALAGADVFNRVGVPGVQRDARFDQGGLMPSGGGAPFVIDNLTIVVNSPMSDREASAIVTVGMGGETGRRIVANNLKVLRRGDG